MSGAGEVDARGLALKARVLDFISEPGDPWPLARAIYDWQVEAVPAYRAFAAGAEPDRLEAIPAVPVSIFRRARFCAAETPGAIFRTSGTTTGRRGEHAMPDVEAYEAAAWAWFRAAAPPCPLARTISLVTDPREHSDSSLGHMIGLFAPGAQWFFSASRGVDVAGARAALAAAEGPVFLPATAFALAELLDARPGLSLAEGSVVMVTGGFKGRRAALAPEALEAAIRVELGPVQILGEYGMTELSSQLWDDGGGFRAPPWLYVYAADPLTGVPVDGEGLLRFVDLANWGSCLAIETEDLGVVEAGRVHLRGRLEGARLRGCSLTAEEARWRARGAQ